MDNLNARPHILKQANLSLIRSAIRNRESVTRGEIVKVTGISPTTVRSLLSEMMKNGEIESIGHDQSSGGRKAERYRLNPNHCYSAVFCISGHEIRGLLVNICGEILEIRHLNAENDDFESVISSYIDELKPHKKIKSIGIGVPGVVAGGSYLKKYINDNKLHRIDIGNNLSKKYGIPVVMENDINATAIGFASCYQKKYPSENPEKNNLAYLHFEKGCVSAGFIVEGKIIHGSNHFAGELGLVPLINDMLFDECLSAPLSDTEYTEMLIKPICWICAILNPRYIVLGGSNLRKDCVGAISDGIYSYLPNDMLAEILYSDDSWYDYYDGMIYLTTKKMFEEVQFVKEIE